MFESEDLLEEFPDVYLQTDSGASPWTATPILLFSYLFVIYGGFLSFTISNSIALLVETGSFQWAEPVLTYHKRGHQWESTYGNINWYSITLHGIALFTMFSYPPEKKSKYDYINQPIVTFFLLFLLIVWQLHSLIWDPTLYTTELLQTESGIFVAQTIFRCLMLGQFFTTFFLLFYCLLTSRPLLRLPESFQFKYFLMLLYLPFLPAYVFQYSKQDGDLSSVLFLVFYCGLIYVKDYFDHR